MKTIKTIFFFSSLFILLTSSSCETNDDLEFGENSFSCYINGELFTPKPSTSISTSPVSKKLIFNRDSFFSVSAKDHDKYTIFIMIRNFEDKNSHSLKLNNTQNVDDSYANIYTLINGKKYISKDDSGIVTFTNVTDSNVEGTFEFTLYNVNDDNDVIQITNGKFND
ncbi:hypothetical protein [Polaribacter sp.]|uniref:hypothetical protein n=1 Tax=Polaribacter sp. TaxID=1920175 RepID=UPI003EF8F733